MSAHVYHQMYFHIVWSTKDRLPFIVDDVREWLVKRVASEACKRNAEVLACNAMPDHVHWRLKNLYQQCNAYAVFGDYFNEAGSRFDHSTNGRNL
jgi:REP element-mobilizing transposase RayT